jgi:hypothetical protein
MEILNQVLIFAGIIAVIVGIMVQIAKNLFPISKNLIPVISILIGILIGVASYPFTDLNVTLRIWSGVFAGLSAVGLYELSTNRSGNTKKDDEINKTL